jgi:stage II sporulation protein E
MEKLQKIASNASTGFRSVNGFQSFLRQTSRTIKPKAEKVFFDWGLLIFLTGFLLGRAFILAKILPFILPFFASVYMMKRERTGLAFIALMIGAVTVSIENVSYAFSTIVMFFIFNIFFSRIKRHHFGLVPFQVFLSVFISHLGIAYLFQQQLIMYDVLMASVEAGLSFILTMIFFQSVPLLSVPKRRQHLGVEEIVCLIILLASIVTGTTDWYVNNMSIQHIVTRYVVILFAYVAGGTVGCTVGVVTGLILSLASVSSLYQMSLLAFSGLLGGMLKEGRKFGAAAGLLIGTCLISFYAEKQTDIIFSIIESVIAIGLFLLTPSVLLKQLAKLVPGTDEYSTDQQQYLRKIRDLTANRIVQFSNVFEALSSSFSQPSQYTKMEDELTDEELFICTISNKCCNSCMKKDHCWSNHGDRTYNYMAEMMDLVEKDKLIKNGQFMREWDKYCQRSSKMADLMKQEVFYFRANQRLKKQVQESRRLVAEQLRGVSKVMVDFAQEIQREKENHQIQEEQILQALINFGIDVNQVEIYSLEQGNIDIEILIPFENEYGECQKLIGPILSDILNETVVVLKEESSKIPNGNYLVTFGSDKSFVIDTGVATAAKGGAFISGDAFKIMDVGAGKHAIAISDGMGNGERAHIESNETLKLLQKILNSGIEETVAIKSINSILSLRTTEEVFATLDLAMIDLHDASAKFLKIGSSPSFVKRGHQVFKVEASNLPIGIIDEFEVEVVSEQLKAGDLLIMMSDGIFEGPRHVENYEMWMKRKIGELETNNPQEVAELLLEEVIRTNMGDINDDMTVVVAIVNRNLPEWTSIPSYSVMAQ